MQSTDKTPPQASNCPTQPIIIKSNSAIVTVSWKEPTFTDNVGVVMTMSSKSPGDKMERDTSLNVRYTAIDAAGNTAHCDFQVSAKGEVPCIFFCMIHSSLASLPSLNAARIK